MWRRSLSKRASSAAVNTLCSLTEPIINNQWEVSPGGGVSPTGLLSGWSERRCDGGCRRPSPEPSNRAVSSVKIGAGVERALRSIHDGGASSRRAPPLCCALTLTLRFRAICLTIASIFQAARLLLGAFLLFPSDNEMLMLFGLWGGAVDTRSQRKYQESGHASSLGGHSKRFHIKLAALHISAQFPSVA